MLIADRKRRVHSIKKALETLECRRFLDATYHVLEGNPLSQDWTDIGMITANNNWAGVPSIVGYTGTGTQSGIDPRTIITSGTNVQVFANNSTPNTSTSGGVYEFELENPTIGMVGSNSAGSPYIQIHLNTTNVSSVDVSYLVRDLESTADNAVQRVALQYRVGDTGNWTNVDAGYVADATTVSTASQVTPVSVTLPAETGNQPLLQVRVINGNASGNDEAIGIDNILVRETPVIQDPGNFQLDPSTLRVNENNNTATIAVTRQGGTGGAVTVDFATADQSAAAGSDYTAASGTLSFADGESTKDLLISLTNDSLDELSEFFTVTLSNPTGGAGLNPTSSRLVEIVDNDGHQLSAGPLLQDWSNPELITVSDDWSGVNNITGYLSDADRDLLLVDVVANQTNPNGQSQGGVAEFDGIANPTVAIQGSNNAPQPQLVFDLNTLGVSEATLAFNAIDLDSTADNAAQSISVQYRVGVSGDFVELFFLEDATEAGLAGLTTAVSVSLPVEALNQDLVQLRIVTNNAGGNDEWVGIDDIQISSGSVVLPPPTMSGDFEFATEQAVVLDFSGDVTATFAASDISLLNTTTSSAVQADQFVFTQVSPTRFELRFLSSLPDGRYTLSVAADSVSVPSGQTNPEALTTQFFVLTGDANRSGTVDFNDLLILARNYNGTGKTFSEGNFNYDSLGTVNFSDLLLLAQRYSKSVFSSAQITAQQATEPATQYGRSGRKQLDLLA